jgi:AcrR family transcriptional regulator
VPVLDRRRREDPRRAQTEQALLQAAEAMLREGSSFAELNVTAIAARAGRTRTAFYAHFEDRRALLLRLIEQPAEEARSAIEPFLRGAAREDVASAVAQLLRTFRQHAVALRAVVEAAGYDEQVAELWSELVRSFAQAAQARLTAEGQREETARATAVALAWMTERTCAQHVLRGHPDVDDEALVEALTATWWRALRAD